MSNRHTNKQPLYELNVKLSFYDIVNALKQLTPNARQDFIEDLQAAMSPSYINSIKEARAEYNTGKVFSHTETFKKHSSKKKNKS
jgi:hypothetical protein